MDQRIEETSVCVVIEDEGQKWLRRLADVRDNKLTKFYFNEDLPWYFANRNRLYLKDGPDSVGNIGVWHWIATPRDTDPSKDFIDAHFVDEISPIEIIELHDINTQNQLIEAIKSGLPLTYSGIDAIYCARVERRKYAGEKLLQRHISMVALQEYLSQIGDSLEHIPAADFLDNHLDDFIRFLGQYRPDKTLLPDGAKFAYSNFVDELEEKLDKMDNSRQAHPELFGVEDSGELADNAKTLLDALYEDGIIPTYSFPKNVVSTYISDYYGKIKYQVERGLDIAINEYAPGRGIVVDKQTYQIGGLFIPGSERKKGKVASPAEAFMDDPNYMKNILSCPECGWFGLTTDNVKKCPFCGNRGLVETRPMLKPWGFAPKDGRAIPSAQLDEEYTSLLPPLYSTLPEKDEMKAVPNSEHIRLASRTDQRIIMLNKGNADHGFMVCKDCGAAMPGDDPSVLNKLMRPYTARGLRGKCRHVNAVNVNLGFDFITDMLILEFALDDSKINTERKENLWLDRAAQSLAEGLRLVVSKELDIEFTELVTGYRLRNNPEGSFVDVYLYDNLSSGAGYAVSVAQNIINC